MKKFEKIIKNFTLVEILIVIAIIGILASLIMPVVSGARKKANNNATQTLIASIDTALEKYKVAWFDYPSAIDVDETPDTGDYTESFPMNAILLELLTDNSRGTVCLTITEKNIEKTGSDKYIIDNFHLPILYSHCRDYYNFTAGARYIKYFTDGDRDPYCLEDSYNTTNATHLSENVNPYSYQIISAGYDRKFGKYSNDGGDRDAHDNIKNW